MSYEPLLKVKETFFCCRSFCVKGFEISIFEMYFVKLYIVKYVFLHRHFFVHADFWYNFKKRLFILKRI